MTITTPPPKHDPLLIPSSLLKKNKKPPDHPLAVKSPKNFKLGALPGVAESLINFTKPFG